MKTKWFTFGQGHVHSVGGFTFDKNIVVQITAPDPRTVMFETFGDKWAMEYDQIPDVAKYFPRGIRRLE
jgi:hypothetical protein